MQLQIEELQLEVKKIFSADPALQQVHLARKILSQEAEHAGMNLYELILQKEKKVVS